MQFTLFCKTSHSFRFHCGIEISPLLFPSMNEEEGQNLGKAHALSPCKAVHGNHFSVAGPPSCWNASSYIKVRMKGGSKKISNKFLLSQTMYFHTKLHNIFYNFSYYKELSLKITVRFLTYFPGHY